MRTTSCAVPVLPMHLNREISQNPGGSAQVCIKTENPAFKDLIKKKFPNTDAKILVACSDGRAYSMEALEALDEMGYTNLVGLKGGYYAWFKVFDNKLNRRCGIVSSHPLPVPLAVLLRPVMVSAEMQYCEND
jgi:rhodanese-related sulfurtransferase